MLQYMRAEVNSAEVFSSPGVSRTIEVGPHLPKGAVCQDETDLCHVVVGRGGCTTHADVAWPQPLLPSR